MYLRVVFAVRPSSLLYSVSQRVIKKPPASDSTPGVGLKSESYVPALISKSEAQSRLRYLHVLPTTLGFRQEVKFETLTQRTKRAQREAVSSFPSQASV